MKVAGESQGYYKGMLMERFNMRGKDGGMRGAEGRDTGRR